MPNPNIAIREAERTIIAAILSNQIAPLETGLSGTEFSDLEFADIFLAAKQMQADGVPEVDFLSLSNFLNVHYKTPESTPPSPKVLMQLAKQSSDLSIRSCVQLLNTEVARTVLAKIGASLISAASDKTESIADILASLDTQTSAVRQTLQSARSRRHISEVMDALMQQYEDLSNGIASAFSTGIGSLDDMTNGGLGFGHIWIIGGFSGGAKSSLATNMALRQSDLGIKSLIISREMIDEDNARRLHSSKSNIPRYMINLGMSEQTLRKLQSTEAEMRAMNIFFDSTSADILSICRSIKEAVQDEGVQIVYVDYIQLLQGIPGAKTTRAEEVATCMRMLNDVAKQLRIAVVVLAQYNRGAAYAGKAENHSFAESSEIEKTATVVLHLSLEKLELESGQRPPTWRRAEIELGKGRDSGNGKLDLWFRGETYTFSEVNPETVEYSETTSRFDAPYVGEIVF